VRIVSKAAITAFSKEHPESLEPLMHWYAIAKRARWQNIFETRQDFGHADPVDDFTVFNIAGNKYRLIATIQYRWQMVYIRHILTHREYSQEKWKS
jgi:mRNA interferase HigB